MSKLVKRKAGKPEKGETERSKVFGFSRYFKEGVAKARMVRIVGNFMGGGFNLSQNKLAAIFENLEELRPFAEGKYDKEIDELEEDDVLTVD